MCPSITQDKGVFHPVTARRWAASGARQFCWVRPNEQLPDAKGQDRPLAAHGGFAFLFHGVEERDTEDRDRYFEIVAAPDVSSAELVGFSL